MKPLRYFVAGLAVSIAVISFVPEAVFYGAVLAYLFLQKRAQRLWRVVA